jgi:hypothetical protein
MKDWHNDPKEDRSIRIEFIMIATLLAISATAAIVMGW